MNIIANMVFDRTLTRCQVLSTTFSMMLTLNDKYRRNCWLLRHWRINGNHLYFCAADVPLTNSLIIRPGKVPKSQNSAPLNCNILLLGDAYVGKTSLRKRLELDDFVATQATQGVELTCLLSNFRGEDLQITIWDPAGQERYAPITKTFFRYSIISRISNMYCWIVIIRYNALHDAIYDSSQIQASSCCSDYIRCHRTDHMESRWILDARIGTECAWWHRGDADL